MRWTRWWVVFAAAALLACGGGEEPGDAGEAGMDAGPPPAPDAFVPPRDARVTLPDTGPIVDGSASDEDGGEDGDASAPTDAGPVEPLDCLSAMFPADAPELGPDYTPSMPVIGSHCLGTNHQDIDGIERVVFLGDSVTVGSPPTASADFYRSRLADMLVARFGLAAPSFVWKAANPLDGTAGTMESGDFASCAKWGARTDDLMRDGTQIADCFPMSRRRDRTLVIVTMGGNDIANIAEAGSDGSRTVDELWVQTREFVQLMRDAVEWIVEPGRFPNGVFVVFANMFEFTDGTGDTSSCPAAELAGLGAPWDDPTALADMVVWANEQYLDLAVSTGTDMIFMLELFCGHGHANDDPTGPCYRGPGTPQWFDLTCIHPNPTGHAQIADMFMAVVDE